MTTGECVRDGQAFEKVLMTKLRKFLNARKFERGQAMSEFAMTLVPFLLLTFGIIQFGRGIYAYNLVSYAAREGSRWASVRGADNTTPSGPATSGTVSSFVKGKVAGVDTNALSVATTWPNGNKNPGSPVDVTVSYPFPLSIPFISTATLQLSSTSEMVISQ
jgi:Flp pilus assembly protein TadG